MKNIKHTFLFICLFTILSCNAQSYIKHTVSTGETISSLALKYKTTPFSIYTLNPDAKNGIDENIVLLIPKGISSKDTNNENLVKTYTAKPQETVYRIAINQKIALHQLYKWNPGLEENGLQDGQTIYISDPKSLNLKEAKQIQSQQDINSIATLKNKITNNKTQTDTIKRVVKVKETKFGISQEYGLSVAQLDSLNPQIRDREELQLGEVLNIVKLESKAIDMSNVYVVKPKETIYSLTQRFNTTYEELLALNPSLVDGLKDGYELILPQKSKVIPEDWKVRRDSLSDFDNKIYETIDFSTQKKLALLLPFNMHRIKRDTTASLSSYINRSPFLKMTIDFYAGAMIAIDSAKTMGLPVDVKILNVESSRNSTDVVKVIKQNNISEMDVVIGPFMAAHLEEAAKALVIKNTPIVSPLTKGAKKSISNLYYSVPTEENRMRVLYKYMNSKNGSISAVISSKKSETKLYLEATYPETNFVAQNERGSFDMTSLKSFLQKGKKNFVILDTENTSLILRVTNTLKALKNQYDIQLVAFELYDTLDFEEIPIQNLSSLNLLFASYKDESALGTKNNFEAIYKRKHKASPNAVAAKGFALTWDTMLRMCQPEGFIATTENFKTEHGIYRFDYQINKESIENNGVYLMSYQEDLTLKKEN